MDEHLAQIRIAPLTDSQQLRLPSGRPLPWYQTQPGRKLSSLVKGRSVPDGRVVSLVSGGLYYRWHQSKPLTEKDTIGLADFANSTGDPVFDDTLKTALNVSLRQSPFLNVLSEKEVAETLQQMPRPTSTKLTLEVASEL